MKREKLHKNMTNLFADTCLRASEISESDDDFLEVIQTLKKWLARVERETLDQIEEERD